MRSGANSSIRRERNKMTSIKGIALGLIACFALQGCTMSFTAVTDSVTNLWNGKEEPKVEEYAQHYDFYGDKGPFNNNRNRIEVVEPNLAFYGVSDTYDIEKQLDDHKRACRKGERQTCNLLGKYYANEGNRREAYKWYSIGCEAGRNPYACGVVKYMEAGGD